MARHPRDSFRPSTVLAVTAALNSALITNCAAKVVESIFEHRAEIISVTSEAEVARIAARAEAEALRMRAQTRAYLLPARIGP